MYTIEITHHDGHITYPLQGMQNILIQTLDIEESLKLKDTKRYPQIRQYFMKNDPSIKSIKIKYFK